MAIRHYNDEDYDLVEKRPDPPGAGLLYLLMIPTIFFGWLFWDWRVWLGMSIGGSILAKINAKKAGNCWLTNIAIIGVYIFTFLYEKFF